MADRFPSLEDFSEGQTEVVEISGASDADDFLARERAALGEDADQFATPQDHVATAQSQNALDDDLLGGSMGAPIETAAADSTAFESSFPAIDTSNEQVAPGGTITGTGAPYYPPTTGYQKEEAESEPMREWREKRDAELARRAEISKEKKEATIKKAREDIDDFYVSYNNKVDKLRAQTHTEAEQFIANRQDTSAGGTSWERIAKLVDISGKGTKGGASGSGKERFRELLLDLRKDEKAPGVSGI
ncbi:hypothetical protein ASPZODRAFT_72233 [Penicilliopsis zonata CBS 506.65]|uniref:Clathrin light chain n=1 Tax=Penicilliopsis zonata CBS 506.65 TaxID=1073090 RepID=A0A1L9SAB1_9EURO|nr:hypothetical protein ASPZODRAFT_72233 [Penicilliopsis zonata CBS 506.65]OJJ44104.1 hypothetical protein ASPZODRAFT_72233 [Penicilliopsis zonata CBS 506.65]